MFCTQCGNRINETERFCTRCGTRAQDAPAAAAGAVVTPIVEGGPPSTSRAERGEAKVGSVPASDIAIGPASETVGAPASSPANLEIATPSAPPVSSPEAAPMLSSSSTPPANPEPVGAPPSTSLAPRGEVKVGPAPPEREFRMFGVEPTTIDSGAGPVAPASSGMGAPFWIMMIVVFAAVVAAGWYAFSLIGGSSSASGVTVQVAPAKLQLAPGAKATISATVAGDPDANVTWSVMEAPNGGIVRANGVIATGGRIAAAAEYIAPQQPGTYHVLATSSKDSKQASSAEVVVAP